MTDTLTFVGKIKTTGADWLNDGTSEPFTSYQFVLTLPNGRSKIDLEWSVRGDSPMGEKLYMMAMREKEVTLELKVFD